MRAFALCLCLFLPSAGLAQDIIVQPLEDLLENLVVEGADQPLDGVLQDVLEDNTTQPLADVVTETQEKVSTAPGARLRGLDKVSGDITDLTPAVGDTVALGWLQITLGDCRFPSGNPAGDGYAWLVIRERDDEKPVFQGWMIASSPALNALDHARFDVWVLGCATTETAEGN